MDRLHYNNISCLFDYPTAEYPKKVRELQIFLQGKYPEAAKIVEEFLQLLPEDNLDEMQELYTRSFDVQSITTLDLGYVLFGDDYKRGELLSNLNREHVKYENSCGGELADHLPNVLRLFSKLQDEELVDDLLHFIIFPAVVKMIEEFNPERIQTKKKSYKKHYKTLIDVSENKETLYVLSLMALDIVLRQDFDLVDFELPEPASDFLRSVETEMKIEESEKA